MKKRLLIANRGEIAVRISKTARDKDFHVIGIGRKIDKGSRYLQYMNEVAYFDSDSVQETFLSSKAIIDLGKAYNTDLLHPGYGFLSESAAFAKDVKKAGITFIGPSAKTLEILGNKVSAKELAEKLSIPTIPGYKGIEEKVTKATIKKIEDIGLPVLIKAGAGGGGRGMRIVSDKKGLEEALVSSRNEAMRAFGDGTLFVEKYIEPARHIEVQVFGDSKGNVIHLFERDCSLQRRFQKIIEVAPASGISSQILEKMRNAALALAKAGKLSNAATMEFLYQPDTGAFYFMECNPRLQVEHTVTEEITGVDLVSLQIDLASGGLLKPQECYSTEGVAIQARVCAEVPEDQGRPGEGIISHCEYPEGVRIDSGISNGSVINNDFDSLLLKVIVKEDTEEQAKESLITALKNLAITGVPLSTGYLVKILSSITTFDETSTSSLGILSELILKEDDSEKMFRAGMVLYAYLFSGSTRSIDPFAKGIRPKEMRNSLLLEAHVPQYEMVKRITISPFIPFLRDSAIRRYSDRGFHILLGSEEYYAFLISSVVDQNIRMDAVIEGYHVEIMPATLTEENKKAIHRGLEGDVIAPLPGTVLSLFVKIGETVEKGQALLSFDSMKTEHVLSAPFQGSIQEIQVKNNEKIERGQLLISLGNK
jgi:acetyl/propionyl-CoA carboxylase alpha subunit